jgi:spore coat polysaccharide biosynthesis protein SpsF
MRVVLVNQARMTSTRLPGKVLLPVLGKPLLTYQLERLRRARRVDQIVIATTLNATDDPIVELCQALGVTVYRGSELDVLDRYYQAALAQAADVVVRVTSDCPVIDPALVDQVIAAYTGGGYDYIANTRERTFPRGMDCEVFSMTALTQAWNEGRLPYEREHVTPFLYQHPERYRIGNVASGRELGLHRWTVDTPEDFDLIQRIITTLYPVKPEFTLNDILAEFERHPDWMQINQHIRQKELGE